MQNGKFNSLPLVALLSCPAQWTRKMFRDSKSMHTRRENLILGTTIPPTDSRWERHKYVLRKKDKRKIKFQEIITFLHNNFLKEKAQIPLDLDKGYFVILTKTFVPLPHSGMESPTTSPTKITRLQFSRVTLRYSERRGKDGGCRH